MAGSSSSSTSTSTANRSSTKSKEIDVRDDIDALKADFEDLKTDLRTLMSDLAGASSAAAVEARDRVAQKVGETKDAAAARGHDAKDYVETRIREKPFESMGFAVAAGMVLGAFLFRRRS
ncbi:MAG: YqjD family protein [Phycisphaerales bacterium]